MEKREKAELEKFNITNALDAAQEWVFNTTRLGWLFLIGVFLIVMKVMGSLGLGDTPWINVLWPFLFVACVILLVTLVFRVRYYYKIVIHSELEAKEYNEMIYKGKRWVKSGLPKTILQMKWIKKN